LTGDVGCFHRAERARGRDPWPPHPGPWRRIGPRIWSSLIPGFLPAGTDSTSVEPGVQPTRSQPRARPDPVRADLRSASATGGGSGEAPRDGK